MILRIGCYLSICQGRNVLFDEFIAVMISAMLWQKVYNYRDITIPVVIERK